MSILQKAIKSDRRRQRKTIILNAALSECPRNVRKALCSNFVNVDAEGYIPQWMRKRKISDLKYSMVQKEYREKRDRRSNKCCENLNIVEKVACEYLAKCFSNELVSENDIYVNVQAPTGSIANMIAIQEVSKIGDTIIAMELSAGGHLSHGSPLHFIGKHYNVMTYGVDEQGMIDYEKIEQLLKTHPKILIAGASSYPKAINWKYIRELIDINSPETVFIADIAHTAGLVAGEVFPSPFGYADIVTMVTYKTFCGARGSAIFSFSEDMQNKIQKTCFPYIIGAPLAAQIAGVAVSAENALSSRFKQMQARIIRNARCFEETLHEYGMVTCFPLTESHIVLLDLPKSGLTLSGEEAANLLENHGIMVNKNMLQGDTSDADASGIRFGFTWTAQKGYSTRKIRKLAKRVISILSTKK